MSKNILVSNLEKGKLEDLKSALAAGVLSKEEEYLLSRNPRSIIRATVAKYSKRIEILDKIKDHEPTVNVLYQLKHNKHTSVYSGLELPNEDHPCVRDCGTKEDVVCKGCEKPTLYYQQKRG